MNKTVITIFIALAAGAAGAFIYKQYNNGKNKKGCTCKNKKETPDNKVSTGGLNDVIPPAAINNLSADGWEASKAGTFNINTFKS